MRIRNITVTFEQRRPTLLPTNDRRRLPSALLLVHSSQLAPPLPPLLLPRQNQGSLVQRTFIEEQTHWYMVITSLVRMRSTGSSPRSTKSMSSYLKLCEKKAELTWTAALGKRSEPRRMTKMEKSTTSMKGTRCSTRKSLDTLTSTRKSMSITTRRLYMYTNRDTLGSEPTSREELLFETVIKPANNLFSSFLRHVTLI